ncbi:MAG TPA: site-specific integrase [Longimicrobiaceae bacterium]|nr:site-specific integrase [Longimicrobiaceae bacterium]
MRGQLINRGEKTFLVRVYLGRDPGTGKRKYYNKTVHGTKKEAEQFLTKKLRDLDSGTLVQPSRRLLADYLKEWLRDVAHLNITERTLEDYTDIVHRHIIPGLGAHPLGRVTRQLVQRFISDLVREEVEVKAKTKRVKGGKTGRKGGKDREGAGEGTAAQEACGGHETRRRFSARTVRYVHSVLHNALEHAVEISLIPTNPAKKVKLPKKEGSDANPLSDVEAKAFLEAAEGTRWFCLWLVQVTTGLRPGEALGLKWVDVDLDTGKIHVQRALVRKKDGTWSIDPPKTDRARRTVALPAETVKVLRRQHAAQASEKLKAGDEYEDYGLVFANRTGGPLDHRVVTRRHFKPLLKKAGLPLIRPYDLRHTHATLLLKAGVNPKIVSERLGHSSVAFTLDTYSHVLPDMQQETAEKLESLLFGGAG